MTAFKKLGLNPEMVKSIEELGFVEPSPIQKRTIPFILNSKKDLIALAQTGTGKTAAFGLPILNQIKADEKETQAIILCPTRELCIQISQDIKKLSKHAKDITITAVYGGEQISLQIRSLKNGTNIIVGTPGRVHDLIKRKIIKLQNIKWLVLDEADQMLDMGFKDSLDAILSQTPPTRQTLLFSATMSRSVYTIAQQYMSDAEEISLGTKNIGAEKVSHEYYLTQVSDRFEALKRILDYLPGVYGIIFCRTKREAQEISDRLKQSSYDTEALHGDVSQNMRTKIMDRFKRKQIHLLVATDVAARGIDVNDLTHVINYSIPRQGEDYTHRSGRTGRAGNSGVSISILNPREIGKIRQLESAIGKEIQHKKIPTTKEIFQKQIDKLVEEIKKINVKKIGNEKCFSEINDKLKKISKEDLIKYFVNSKFNDFAGDNSHSRDLNAEPGSFTERKRSGGRQNKSYAGNRRTRRAGLNRGFKKKKKIYKKNRY